ncbi:MAG: Radical domain protein [Candidatus Sulfotelmatobacter sp.]|nr:Radical domain protein [Candidatus Sulfotelmatobacter sp.]
MSLMAEMGERAHRLGVPFSVQLDLTYRCNEQCVHCYLDHHDHGEMTTAEIKKLLREMADAGVFILTLSGGEIFLRKDFFEILEYARALTFCIKLKTNAVLIREAQAARLRDLGVESIQISIYSHRPEVHDAITKLPGSLRRSIKAIRFLRSQGLKVVMANVLMTQNMDDYPSTRALADELGAEYTLDPTVTPMMDGDRAVLDLNVGESALRRVFRDETLVGNADEFCAPPRPLDDDSMDSTPCSAGHTACYVSPYGEFYPCVQFPLSCGNVRQQSFIDIWHNSEQLKEVRSIRLRDLSSCSQCAHGGSCTRCPGLAFLEGNMRGPSTADCERSFARTGIPSANLLAKKDKDKVSPARLVQIQLVPVITGVRLLEMSSAACTLAS